MLIIVPQKYGIGTGKIVKTYICNVPFTNTDNAVSETSGLKVMEATDITSVLVTGEVTEVDD